MCWWCPTWRRPCSALPPVRTSQKRPRKGAWPNRCEPRFYHTTRRPMPLQARGANPKSKMSAGPCPALILLLGLKLDRLFQQFQQKLDAGAHIAQVDDLGRGVNVARGDGDTASRQAAARDLHGRGVGGADLQDFELGGQPRLRGAAQQQV